MEDVLPCREEEQGGFRIWEAETEESLPLRVLRQIGLHSEFQVNLDHNVIPIQTGLLSGT